MPSPTSSACSAKVWGKCQVILFGLEEVGYPTFFAEAVFKDA